MGWSGASLGIWEWGTIRVGARVGDDCRNELADFLDLVVAPLGDEVAGEDLRGEQRGPGDASFRFAAGPFPAVEGLNRELDDELVGG